MLMDEGRDDKLNWTVKFMEDVIVTIIVQAEIERRIDLEIPRNLTVKKCKEMLRLANWMPVSEESNFEISLTGEEWLALEEDEKLAEHLNGDGAIIRISAI